MAAAAAVSFFSVCVPMGRGVEVTLFTSQPVVCDVVHNWKHGKRDRERRKEMKSKTVAYKVI